MPDQHRDALWIPTFAALIAFAVPWFLWGVDAVVAGLPVWVWWHVGWLCLCAVLFARFAAEAWDRGMDLDFGGAEGRDAARDESSGGAGDRRTDGGESA